MPVGLHHLRYFVAVAEDRNMSRAAQRLHVAQPSLSAQIKYLEKTLGVTLFRRHPGGMEPTRAGALFLAEARHALESADAAVAVARMAARGDAGTLRLGLIVGTYVEPTAGIVKAFQHRHPKVQLDFAEHTFADPSAGLNANTTDLAFVQPPFTHDGLRFLEIYTEPRVAVLPDSHPLADSDAVSVRELFGEPWIVADTDDTVCRDFWLAVGHRDGVPARLGPVTQTMDKFIRLVLVGEVIGLAEASMQQAFPRPGIRYVPVPDVEPVATVLAWRPGTPNRLVASFVAVAQEQLAR
jgi:DNA-binding transcriptional LysR family regulator